MQQWFRAADDDNIQYIVQHQNLMHHSLDEFGNTALIRAAFSGSIHVVRELADVEAGVQNQIGRSALMQSVFSSSAYVTAQHLMKELRLQDSQGQTALMLAASQNKTDIVKILLKEQKMKDLKGRTALMIASSCNYVDVVKELVQSEATIQDNQGLTALHYAAYKNNFTVVALLAEIENGILSNKGETALSIAIQRNSTQSIQILSKYESHIKIQGLDVHQYALEIGLTNKHILEMLNAIKQPDPQMDIIQLERQAQQNDEITNKINQLEQQQQDFKQQMNIDAYDLYQQQISAQQQQKISRSNIHQQTPHEINKVLNEDVNRTLQRMQTQLNQLQSQSQTSKFIQEFDGLSMSLNTQIADLRQKIDTVSLDVVKSKANIVQLFQIEGRVAVCEEKTKEVDFYQGQISQIRQETQQNHAEITNIKTELNMLAERVSDLEIKLADFMQRQDSANAQLCNTFQPQPKAPEQLSADLTPVYQQIQELQHNMLRIIDLQQSKAQNPMQDTLLQLVHDVDLIKTQFTRMQVQNYNERIEALEQSIAQICQMLGGP